MSEITKREAAARTEFDLWDIPDPRYPVFLIDTSHWTGLVNWELYRARGGMAAILKAMDGKSLDSQFKANYRAAKDAGVLLSTYQWLYGVQAVSPGGQAREYAALLRDYPVDFLPFVDYEPYLPARSKSPKLNDLNSYIEPFEQAYGFKPGIYTGYYYWLDAGSPSFDASETPLWIARYKATAPLIPRPWTNWTFWQFTESADGEYWGSPPDGERGIDMSYFNGTLGEFLAYCGRSTPPPPPPPPATREGVVTTPVLNVRSGPDVSYAKVGKLYAGDVIRTDRSHGLWLHLTHINGQAVTTESWCHSGWVSFAPPPKPPPPPPPPPIPPVVETRPLFNGSATYIKASGEGLTYHMVKVDMSRASVLITHQGRRMSLSTTEHFLKANRLQLAINGDGFRYRRDKRDYELEPAGFASSKGKQYGKLGREQTIFISKEKEFSLAKPARKADIWDAISFPNLLVKDGTVAWSKTTPPAPRTCLGWTQDQKTLIILVVDGRELDQTGMTLETCARLLKQEGAWVGVNMDGGGSSTLVIEENGGPVVLNVPTDDNVFGKQRPVLNHFGLFIG